MTYDALIIGAGSMGMAAGYYLSKQGKRVLLIDPFDPPHTEGSHHGATRLIRHAYGEGEGYVPMALRAQQLWHELEEASGAAVFHRTGVLNIGTEDSLFLKNVILSAERYSLPHDILSAREINERWPGFRLPEQLSGCYESNSGVLMSEEAIRVFRELAVSHGAELLTHTRAEKIEERPDGVTVTANGRSYSAKQLIITAGKGTNTVLSLLGEQLPLAPMRTTFSWFDADEEVYNPGAFPAWTYDDGVSGFYGFPSIDGTGLKIGNHGKGTPVSPEEKLMPFSFETDAQDVADFLLRHTAFEPAHREGKACTYTNSPDEDFIIDRLPGHANVLVACGFSGHGFKFTSVVGEILSELVTTGTTKQDISAFAISRFNSN